MCFEGEYHRQLTECRKLLKMALRMSGSNKQLASSASASNQGTFSQKAGSLLAKIEQYEVSLRNLCNSLEQERQ